MEELFCEPFPGTSWILPPDFPYKDGFWVGSSDSYLHMLENNVVRYDDSGAAALRLLPPGADTAPAPESHVLRGGPPRARQVQLDGAPVRQLLRRGAVPHAHVPGRTGPDVPGEGVRVPPPRQVSPPPGEPSVGDCGEVLRRVPRRRRRASRHTGPPRAVPSAHIRGHVRADHPGAHGSMASCHK